MAHEALTLGYKVRGAVRSLEKAAWLEAHFNSVFPGQYSQVHLNNIADASGLAEAVKGVAGIIHVAVNTDMTPNPEPYVPQTIEETLKVLKVAGTEPSVKSVVLTSSSVAAAAWGAKGKIPEDAYNEEMVKLAWDPTFEHPAKKFFVYAAAKAQSEQAAWKYVKEQNPSFNLNTVLPNCNLGPSLVYEKQGHPSTGGWPKSLFDGDTSTVASTPPSYFIDVRDTAKLHIAALVDPEISSERLWGFAEPFNWNTVLAIFRKVWPEKKFLDDLPNQGWDESIASTESALKALRNVYGQEGWTSLEKSIRDAGYDRAAAEEVGNKLSMN